MTELHPVRTATEYEVSYLPEDHPAYRSFVVRVSYRGRDLWAVQHAGHTYNADGERSHEPFPSEREEGWLKAHRFDLDTALEIAERVGRKIVSNGYSVEDVLNDKHRGNC